MPREVSLKTLEKQRPTFAGALEPKGGVPGRASIGSATVGYTGYLPGMTSKICSSHEAQLCMSEGFIKAMRSSRGVHNGRTGGAPPHPSSATPSSSSSVGGLTHFIPLQSPAPPRHIVGYNGHRPGMEEGAQATGQTFNRLERLTDRGYTQRGPSYEEITQYVAVPHNRPVFRTAAMLTAHRSNK